MVDVLFGTLVRAAHVSSDEDVRGAEAVVESQGLLETLLGGKVDVPLLNAVAEGDSHDQTTIDLSFGSLTLGVGVSGRTSRMETTHKLGATAHFRLGSEHSLTDIDDLVEPLRDFIVFATRHPAFVSGLRLLQLARPRRESST